MKDADAPSNTKSVEKPSTKKNAGEQYFFN